MFSFLKKEPLIDGEGQQRITAAIAAAEARTTREIRVYVETRCAYMDAMDRAVELFAGLGMDKTERRNAVIVYLAIKDQQFAIFGDQEIFIKAGGPVFWEKAAAEMKTYLKAGQYAEGLAVCVNELG